VINHPCFDDATHQICVRGKRRRYVPNAEWNLLTLLRERFGRFVPPGFLAQETAFDPADGGSINALRVRVASLRRQLAGSPFAIATAHAVGYGLFPLQNVEAVAYRQPRPSSLLARDTPAWPIAQFPLLSNAIASAADAPRQPPLRYRWRLK